MHKIHFQLSKTIITEATWCYWKRSASIQTIIALVALLACFIMYIDHLYRQLLIIPAFIAILVLVVSFMSYYVFLYRGYAIFQNMKRHDVTWELHDDKVIIRSEIGNSETPWDSFKKLWCFDNVWLLFYTKNLYSFIPTTALSSSDMEYLKTKVKDNGSGAL